jgi:hypothetical protein
MLRDKFQHDVQTIEAEKSKKMSSVQKVINMEEENERRLLISEYKITQAIKRSKMM